MSLVVEVHEIVGLPTFGAVTDVNAGCSSISIASTAGPAPKAYVPTGSDQEEPQ